MRARAVYDAGAVLCAPGTGPGHHERHGVKSSKRLKKRDDQQHAEERYPMKLLRPVFFVMLMASLMLGQSNAPATNTSPDPTAKISDQIKSLQDAITQQQKQIEMLQQQLAEQKDAQAKMVNATYTAPSTATTAAASDMQELPKESPLSFRIGGAEFTPGGFVDFENVFRSTNTTNVAATSFGAIPFSNTVQGHLTEFRTTGQYSRLNLRIDTTFKENKVRASVEGDLNGNDPTNV